MSKESIQLFTANTGATKHRLKYTLGDDGFYTLEERQKNYEAYKNDTLDKNAVDFSRKVIKYQRPTEDADTGLGNLIIFIFNIKLV